MKTFQWISTILLGLTPLVAFAGTPSLETRSHMSVTRNRSPIYIFTFIRTGNDIEDSLTALINEPDGSRLVLREVRDYSSGLYTYQVLEEGNELIALIFEMPFEGETRQEVKRELARRGASMDVVDVPVTIRIGDESETYLERDLQERPGVRRSAFARADPGLISRLMQLRKVFAWPEMIPFCNLVALATGDECPDTKPFRERALKFATNQPNCDYDASFGYPCTPEMKERVAAARSQNKVLRKY